MRSTIRGSFKAGPRNQRENAPRMPSRKGIGRAIEVISVDIFNVQIPVFVSDEDRVHELRKRGFPAEPCDRGHYGLVSCCYDDAGFYSLAMVITPGATGSTIPHECSHLVDFIFDHVGIPGGIESTELRAYLTGYLIEKTEEMIAKNQERYPRLYGIEPMPVEA